MSSRLRFRCDAGVVKKEDFFGNSTSKQNFMKLEETHVIPEITVFGPLHIDSQRTI